MENAYSLSTKPSYLLFTRNLFWDKVRHKLFILHYEVKWKEEEKGRHFRVNQREMQKETRVCLHLHVHLISLLLPHIWERGKEGWMEGERERERFIEVLIDLEQEKARKERAWSWEWFVLLLTWDLPSGLTYLKISHWNPWFYLSLNSRVFIENLPLARHCRGCGE